MTLILCKPKCHPLHGFALSSERVLVASLITFLQHREYFYVILMSQTQTLVHPKMLWTYWYVEYREWLTFECLRSEWYWKWYRSRRKRFVGQNDDDATTRHIAYTRNSWIFYASFVWVGFRMCMHPNEWMDVCVSVLVGRDCDAMRPPTTRPQRPPKRRQYTAQFEMMTPELWCGRNDIQSHARTQAWACNMSPVPISDHVCVFVVWCDLTIMCVGIMGTHSFALQRRDSPWFNTYAVNLLICVQHSAETKCDRLNMHAWQICRLWHKTSYYQTKFGLRAREFCSISNSHRNSIKRSLVRVMY